MSMNSPSMTLATAKKTWVRRPRAPWVDGAVRLYQDGVASPEIARIVKRDVTTVCDALRRAGIVLKHKKRLEHPDFADKIIKMASDGLNLTQIAASSGFSRDAVNGFLATRGITATSGLNKPAARSWKCHDYGQEKDADCFPHWRTGRPVSPCKECRCLRVVAYAKDHREIVRETSRNTRRRFKKKVIDAYGGRCACCGESDLTFLSIDHENNDGKDHRQRVKRNVWYDLYHRGFPKDEGIRVLCYNCNFGRRPFACCPHKFEGAPQYLKINAVLRWRRKRRLALLSEILAAYGGGCACCGEENIYFLSLDHVHGDGASHRIGQRRLTGIELYDFVKKLGFPDNFQILCYNCNFAKGQRLCCPHQEGAHVARV